MRSREPKTNSARAFESSVLPTPVGPAKKSTPTGRRWSARPALITAMISVTRSTAPSWPLTRARKNSLTRSGSSGMSSRRSTSGIPDSPLKRSTASWPETVVERECAPASTTLRRKATVLPTSAP